jgi:hypothetical protein
MSKLKVMTWVGVLLTMSVSPALGLSPESQKMTYIDTLNSLSILETSDQSSPQTKIQKLLSDHPGAATALTVKQKAEIRTFVRKAKGRETIVCTGLGLSGQRESMYRVVKLRAELVCEYVLSLDPNLKTTIQEKTTKIGSQNGRVHLSSR